MPKKTIILFFLYITTNFFGQTFSGGLKLNIQERIKSGDGRQYVTTESITIVLNDSITHILTTDQEGSVSIKSLQKGKYKVKIIRTGCQASEVRDIIIGEGKTAYVTLLLTCASYINSLTKKEKRKLGYK